MMRGGMGNMNNMMKQMQKMQKEMAKAQEELGEKTVEGTAGAWYDYSYCKWS
ncbi:YbaB/EbfC family nucleoid-associated protein [Bacillus paranthracis]